MGTLKWYKRDPRAALTGMMVLSLEERGAYNTVLDLIYAHDGKLADDPKFISVWLGVDPRVWKRIRLRLIERGKLYIHAGCIHNQKADEEVLAALHRVASATEAADKRWATYNEIKRIGHAPRNATYNHTYKAFFLKTRANQKVRSYRGRKKTKCNGKR